MRSASNEPARLRLGTLAVNDAVACLQSSGQFSAIDCARMHINGRCAVGKARSVRLRKGVARAGDKSNSPDFFRCRFLVVPRLARRLLIGDVPIELIVKHDVSFLLVRLTAVS